MQNVKNFIQGKALGVAEYLTPILKVMFEFIFQLFCVANGEVSFYAHLKTGRH